MKSNFVALSPWITAIRAKTLTAGLAPVIVGFTFALSDGFFNWRILTMIVIATLAIQIATNLVNDYSDFVRGIDDKTRVGFPKVLVEGTVSLHAMRKAIFLIFAIAGLASTYLILKGGWPIAVIALSSIFFAITYSAGPFPLSSSGLADLVELIYFGPVATAGTYFLLTHKAPLVVILGGFIPGFLSLAILTIDNLRDFETDKAKGKTTLCVRFGPKFAQLQYYFCLFCGFTLPLVLIAITRKHFLCLSCFILLPLYKTALDAVKENKDSQSLNKALKQTAACLFLFALVFSAGWLI